MRILFTGIYWLLILFKNDCLTFLLCIACVSVAFGTFSEQVLSSLFFLTKWYMARKTVNSKLAGTALKWPQMPQNDLVIHTREGVWQSSGTFSYVDVLDIKNGNWKLIISLFRCCDSTKSYWGSKTKPFRFVVWDRSIPSSKTLNFQLLLMMSGTSAFLLLKLANIYLSSFTLFWTAMRDWTFPYKLLHLSCHTMWYYVDGYNDDLATCGSWARGGGKRVVCSYNCHGSIY